MGSPVSEWYNDDGANCHGPASSAADARIRRLGLPARQPPRMARDCQGQPRMRRVALIYNPASGQSFWRRNSSIEQMTAILRGAGIEAETLRRSVRAAPGCLPTRRLNEDATPSWPVAGMAPCTRCCKAWLARMRRSVWCPWARPMHWPRTSGSIHRRRRRFVNCWQRSRSAFL